MTDLAPFILQKVKSADLWGSKARENGRFFQGLTCPECGKAEAWICREKPFTLHCNRQNRCGATIRTLDLFPEILRELEDRSRPTQEDPHRPARAYLELRGIHKAVSRLAFEYWPNVRKTGSGAVMFPVGDAWNGRLINPPPGEGKTHNRGTTAGKFWKHPGREYDPTRETFVAEGILDALSLLELDLQAMAVLSAGANPEGFDFGALAGKLVFAFDCDHAGGNALRKWKARHPEAGAVTPVWGDWNDFLLEHGDQARARFDELRAEFETRARLQLSESAEQYAETWHGFYGYPAGLFDFRQETWFSSVSEGKNGVTVHCRRVGNFTLSADHFQREAPTPDEPTFRFHLGITPKTGAEIKCTLAGSDLAQPGNLRGALLTRARVLWEGDQNATMALLRKITSSRAPVVRQIRVTGHDDQKAAFIFRDFAITRSGAIVHPDKRGFIQGSGRELLRPPNFVTINPEPGVSVGEIYELIAAAWPGNGPLAVAFAVGSWFVETIRPELGFFPFLSLWGDPQTGKSNLIQTCNRLQCIDEEGLPMSKLNTGKGELRKLAQRAGLFIALLESNKSENTRFQMDTLLTLFNHGNPLQVRAQKSNDNGTHELPFRAALAFIQNTEPFTSRAQRERVISSKKFEQAMLTEDSRAAFRELTAIPARKLAHFFVDVMQRRVQLEKAWRAEYETARDEVFSAVSDNRISETHGLMLGIHRTFCQVMGLREDLRDFIVEIAARKVISCADRAASLADTFFQGLDLLSDQARGSCLELRDGKIFVQLTKALQQLNEARAPNLPVGVLHEDLRRHPAFIEGCKQYRGYFGAATTTSCRTWVFDAAKIWQC
jgi:hypothetical protein